MCDEQKPAAEFYVLQNRRQDTGARYDRLSAYCRPCMIVRSSRWQKKNPESYRKAKERYRHSEAGQAATDAYTRLNRYRNYGITGDEYNRLLTEQGGVCRICGKAPNGRELAVDHDHGTGEVRGLLCGSCNSGLGMFRDDPHLLAEAKRYLIERVPLDNDWPGAR